VQIPKDTGHGSRVSRRGAGGALTNHWNSVSVSVALPKEMS
jgi:hypothetical protein